MSKIMYLSKITNSSVKKSTYLLQILEYRIYSYKNIYNNKNIIQKYKNGVFIIFIGTGF